MSPEQAIAWACSTLLGGRGWIAACQIAGNQFWDQLVEIARTPPPEYDGK